MRGDTYGQVNLTCSKARQKTVMLLAESSGRPLEHVGNDAPREMTAAAKQHRTRRIAGPFHPTRKHAGYSAENSRTRIAPV